jgi:hypothetical protein
MKKGGKEEIKEIGTEYVEITLTSYEFVQLSICNPCHAGRQNQNRLLYNSRKSHT